MARRALIALCLSASGCDCPGSAADTSAPAAAESAIAAPTAPAPTAAQPERAGHDHAAHPEASASATAAPPKGYVDTRMRLLRVDFSDGPLYFVGSFDGSQRYSMWLDSMQFARELDGLRPHFTYFVNACYFSTAVRGSLIGRAHSNDEVLVRRALVQQAINEGHEIGNHGVRHEDGGQWDAAKWQAELDEFHAIMDPQLFEPIVVAGRPLFPRFAAVASGGATGARCKQGSDCASGQCLTLTDALSVCTQACNRHAPCPSETVCGAPTFHDDTDVCVPKPRYPIVLDGKTLFDAEGKPNREHPRLVPYRIRGFRAPFLSVSDGLTRALLERGYRYDASQVAMPGPPMAMKLPPSSKTMMAFALMPHDSAIIPMDYNYLAADADGERMSRDYRHSLLEAYRHPRRYPWSVGHHFSTWRDGEYWEVLKDTYRWLAADCPSPSGPQCPDVAAPNYADLYSIVRAHMR